MDALRRCDARDKDGHRCRKHLFHLLEVPTGVELPGEPEAEKHVAFGRSF